MDLIEPTETTDIGRLIVDIQLMRRALSEDPYMERYLDLIEAAEKRLDSMSALDLVKALFKYSDMTNQRLKI